MRFDNSVDRAVGLWSARIMILLAILYVLTGTLWVISPARTGPAFEPPDPYLAILEIILVLGVLVEVPLFSSIYGLAGAEQETYARVALIFISMLCAISTTVHFVLLTAGRQTGYAAIPGEHAFYPWPTVLFSIELLAWDVFQGLGLVFAAPVFRGNGLVKAVRWCMYVSGGLCLAGVSGPASGEMRLQALAIAGYVGGLTVVCALLAFLFARYD